MTKFTLIIGAALIGAANLTAQTDKARAARLDNAINSEFTDAGPVFTPDGKTMFFKRKTENKNYDVFKSTQNEQGN